jgi:hypothetical protein
MSFTDIVTLIIIALGIAIALKFGGKQQLHGLNAPSLTREPVAESVPVAKDVPVAASEPIPQSEPISDAALIVVLAGVLVTVGGWLFLVFGVRADTGLSVQGLGLAVVNLHLLTIASNVIYLGYFLILIGVLLELIRTVQRTANKWISSLGTDPE